MTLQTSPPISLTDIKEEFGATGTRSLTDLYRGGAFVPNIPANNGVPTSGTISLLNFLGATNFVSLKVTAPDVFVSVGSPPAVGYSTATASGGTGGPYTFSWTRVSGQDLLVGPPVYATAEFRSDAAGAREAVYRVTVSDGTSTAYDDINVLLEAS